MIKFLGMCVDYNEAKRIFKISNAPIIDGSLQRFVLTDASPVPTPEASGMCIELDESGN